MLRAARCVAAAACAALGVVACSSDSDEPMRTASSPRLSDLTNIGQLRSSFNEHDGVPRLILLLSPT